MSDEQTEPETVEIEIPQPRGYRVLAVIIADCGTAYVDEAEEEFLERLKAYRRSFDESRDHRERVKLESELFFTYTAIGAFEERDENNEQAQITQRVVNYPSYLTYQGVMRILQIGYAWMPHGPLPQPKVPVIVQARQLPPPRHPHLRRR